MSGKSAPGHLNGTVWLHEHPDLEIKEKDWTTQKKREVEQYVEGMVAYREESGKGMVGCRVTEDEFTSGLRANYKFVENTLIDKMNLARNGMAERLAEFAAKEDRERRDAFYAAMESDWVEPANQFEIIAIGQQVQKSLAKHLFHKGIEFESSKIQLYLKDDPKLSAVAIENDLKKVEEAREKAMKECNMDDFLNTGRIKEMLVICKWILTGVMKGKFSGERPYMLNYYVSKCCSLGLDYWTALETMKALYNNYGLFVMNHGFNSLAMMAHGLLGCVKDKTWITEVIIWSAEWLVVQTHCECVAELLAKVRIQIQNSIVLYGNGNDQRNMKVLRYTRDRPSCPKGLGFRFGGFPYRAFGRELHQDNDTSYLQNLFENKISSLGWQLANNCPCDDVFAYTSGPTDDGVIPGKSVKAGVSFMHISDKHFDGMKEMMDLLYKEAFTSRLVEQGMGGMHRWSRHLQDTDEKGKALIQCLKEMTSKKTEGLRAGIEHGAEGERTPSEAESDYDAEDYNDFVAAILRTSPKQNEKTEPEEEVNYEDMPELEGDEPLASINGGLLGLLESTDQDGTENIPLLENPATDFM